MKPAKIAAKWVVRLVLIAFLGVVLAAVAVLIVLPRATHGTALTVLTGSMTPDIPVGSVVIDRPVDPGTLHVGDVATYQKARGVNEYITHRIVKIDTSTTPTSFIFKGDANRGPDMTAVPSGAIRGKVWFHVPYLGSIRDSLGGALGRTLLIALVVVALAGYAVTQLVSVVRDRRRPADSTAPVDAPDLALSGADDAAPGELAFDFDLETFGEVDPSFVAELLQGECEVLNDSRFRLNFTAPPRRLAVVRELLAPYGTVVGAELPTPEEDAVERVGSEPREDADIALSADSATALQAVPSVEDQPARGTTSGSRAGAHGKRGKRKPAHV
jgi:signal peptidase